MAAVFKVKYHWHVHGKKKQQIKRFFDSELLLQFKMTTK